MLKAPIPPVSRRLQVMFRIPLLLALVLFGVPARAIGPEAPVDFLDVYAAKGFMLMVVEPDQVVDVELTRTVHRDGEPLAQEKVDWRQLRMLDYTAPITGPEHFQYRDPRERKSGVAEKSVQRRLPSIDSARPRPDLKLAEPNTKVTAKEGPPRRVGVLIPLEAPSQVELKEGAYAEKFAARVRLAGEAENAKPLSVVRWSHFVIKDRKPRFVSQAEYSRMVDPPSEGLNGAGRRIQLSLGRDVKSDVPIERTERNFALPLQHGAGAVVPERDDSRPCDKSSKLCNEAQER